MVEGARLESVFRGNSNVGSNPTLSATNLLILKIVNSSFGRLRPAALSVVPPWKISAVHAVGEAEALNCMTRVARLTLLTAARPALRRTHAG